jgi:hypothetical protein
MPEPYDTIQRVEREVASMPLDELRRARRVLLDDYGSGTRGDVAAARRKVEARIAELDGWPTAPAAAQPARSGRKGGGVATLGVVILSVIVAVVVFAVSRAGSEDSGDSSAAASRTTQESTEAARGASFKDRRGFAWEACKSAVENELKAPSTADFPSVLDAQFREATTETIVVGAYVDAQNGFGAMIRSDWICSADFAAGTTDVQSATVISLTSR